MHILVVDDDPVVRALTQEALESAGHRVTLALDGAEALELVAELSPQLVVCGVMMPKVNGGSVVTALRADERFARLPVLMLTGRGMPQDVQTGRDVGATALLAKPFAVEELTSLVDALGCLRR